MYFLFLDDQRNPEEVLWIKLPKADWIIVRNYLQFVSHVQRFGIPIYVAFDNDLGFEDYVDPEMVEPDMLHTERNGFDCAKWLVNYCMEKNIKFPEYAVHSMNCVAKDNIISYIECYKKHEKDSK